MPRPSLVPRENKKPVGENALVSVGETNTEDPIFRWGKPPLRSRWGKPPLPLESRVHLRAKRARECAKRRPHRQSAAPPQGSRAHAKGAEGFGEKTTLKKTALIV